VRPNSAVSNMAASRVVHPGYRAPGTMARMVDPAVALMAPILALVTAAAAIAPLTPASRLRAPGAVGIEPEE
jgi:hypothetical protein